ncbi:hypothetical protein ACHAW6_003981 [Cyclotella cf. meneghiniana]
MFLNMILGEKMRAYSAQSDTSGGTQLYPCLRAVGAQLDGSQGLTALLISDNVPGQRILRRQGGHQQPPEVGAGG